MRAVRYRVLVFAALACACARPAPPPVAAPEPEPEKIDRGPSSSDSDIGGLSQEDVEDQFKALHPQLMECVQRSSTRLVVLGGRATFRLRITRAGMVRWAFIPESTLGDREAERCMLGVIREQTWPRPLSGEGLAESSLEVDPGEPAAEWPKHKQAALADKAARATGKCRSGVAGTFRATAYVGPRGEVLAAGIAPPNAQGEDASDCMAKSLRALRVGNLTVGQRGVAKVSFLIR
jgi:hypothetical protein